ncbi:MAG: serine protease [Bacteroidetes bacterium]|nr:serine protease [Bacteroidota bacterium]
MRKFCIILIFVTITTTFSGIFATQKTIYKIDLKKEIGSTTWLYIQKGFDDATNQNADFILIHMNTYGGEVLYADSIRTKILNTRIPVYVFVDNNAASAGALIAISCDKIFMRPGSSIGAATVVNNTGEQMPDKYQSYMRATMRATAEAHGKDTVVNGKDTTYRWKRDPMIAEAMVDDRTVIPGIIDSGKTLTFTAQEAIKYHYCEGMAENVDELIVKQLKINDYKLVTFEPSSWDNIKGFLMSSVIQGLLIMLIIGGIYFELQTPGIGFPLGLAIVAAILYFAPLYMDGLAANWEILIFIIGLILLAVEIFVIPGFGVAGISGIILIVAGLTLSLLGNIDFNFEPVQGSAVSKALLTVIGGLTVGFGLTIYLSSRIGSKGIFRKMALETTMENSSGYLGVPVEVREVVGKTGIASTVLRLSGKVMIEGKVYDAFSEDGFIEKGTLVKVVRYETGQIYVVKTDAN